MAPDEATPLGSPQEVASRLETTYTAPLTWYDRSGASAEGSSLTQLELSVTPDLESARFIDRELEPGACGPTLEMEATAGFVTQDGTFAEELRGTLIYGTTAYLDTQGFYFVAELPIDELIGSYDLSGIATQRYENPYYEFRTTLSPLQGSCWMGGTDPDDDPNTTLVSVAIADWSE